MDLGVGCVIFSAGVVAARRFINIEKEANRNQAYQKSIENLYISIKHSIPLLLIGFIRLAAVKSTNYQEHVNEYGIHWNFFFTICLTSLLTSALYIVFKNRFRAMSLILIISNSCAWFIISLSNCSFQIWTGAMGFKCREN